MNPAPPPPPPPDVDHAAHPVHPDQYALLVHPDQAQELDHPLPPLENPPPPQCQVDDHPEFNHAAQFHPLTVIVPEFAVNLL